MITNDQIKVIKMIEDNLELTFTGTTKKDATEFITKNMTESKNVSDKYKQMLLSNYGGYKEIWRLLNIKPN